MDGSHAEGKAASRQAMERRARHRGVEYAMLLAMISGGIVVGLEFLGGAVSDQLSEAALRFGDDGIVDCGNDGGGDGTGGDGGTGEGGANTC